MVRASRCKLVLHLVKVDLESAQLKLIFIGLQLVRLDLLLELFNLALTLAIHLTEANHLALVLLQLTRGVLQVFHKLLCLSLVCLHELLGFLEFKREMLFLTLKAVICRLKNVHLEFHFGILFLSILDFVTEEVQ